MDALLTPVSTSYSHNTTNKFLNQDEKSEEVPALTEIISEARSLNPRPSFQASTPEQALEILKNEPDYTALITTLKFLTLEGSEFNITSPSPLAAQVVHILVSDTLPTYWDVLKEGEHGRTSGAKRKPKARKSSELDLLLSCLRSVVGLNAVLLSLKQHIQQSKTFKKAVGGHIIQDTLSILLQALQLLFEGDETVRIIWKIIHDNSEPDSKQAVLWNEFLALTSTKVPGLAAEAEDIVRELSKSPGTSCWVADGSLYSKWLARNITCWAESIPEHSELQWKNCSQILNMIIKQILNALVFDEKSLTNNFIKLISHLPNFEQRNFLYTVLKIVSRDYLSAEIVTEADAQWWKSDSNAVSSAAGLLELLLRNIESCKGHLIAWLTNSSGAGAGDGIAIRRAALVALSSDKNDIETVLEKSLQQVGDQLYIKHTPAMQQEVHAQVLLLSAGYFHRKAPLRFSMMMRSGTQLNVVSNRLAASSPRARFLGMVIGESLSSLVDKGINIMDFKMDETKTPEAKWYKSLIQVSDTVGSFDSLRSNSVAKANVKPASKPAKPQPGRAARKATMGTKIVAIEEIEDDDEVVSDDNGLVPFAKPDSDAEDSDEDATLVTRNKPTAPVYIRDLIGYLRDSENYDKQKLGLSTAASLIRRKSKFGTEVSSHAEELATLLVGLQDKYQIETFEEKRLQGMIAILLSLPLKMGQWFSKTFFDGDYSVSQRASILSTLGLGARELGGFSTEDLKLNPSIDQASFPSKSLPETMHKRYTTPKALPLSPLESLSTQLQNTFITPMATTLADKITGPSILKVRTFSSRMAVEEKRKKPIANELAKIVAEGFFFPLTGRFFMHLKAYGSSKSNIVFQPHLVSLFIKTLSLLLHASGPSTLSLPQMTSEFWNLLLSLRTQSIGDIIVIESLLFAFLTILEINEDKRKLVDAHGRQMLETQEWVEGVFGRVGAGGSEEDERVRMLAAGVLMRIREVVEKYQALLMGDLASFQI